MSEIEDEALLDDITCVEMENDSNDEEEMVASTEVFGADPLRTLGEILAYCQVMYGAIRKLDEKLDLLQARVTNIQTEQLSPQIQCEELSSFPLLSPSPPPPPPSPPLEDIKPPRLLLFSENSASCPSASTSSSQSHSVRKMILKQQQSDSSPAGNGRFVFPGGVLQKAGSMLRPTSAARFLLRSIFSHQELLQSNTKGDPARGLNQLDPHKITAIREWLKKKYPKYDLNEKGKDWRACVAVMNKGARYIRLMEKKRKSGSAGVVTDVQCSSQLEAPPTAEIDVELSDSDDERVHKQKVKKIRHRRESDHQQVSDHEDHVYLGSPGRQVKVPQSVMYTSWQRPSAPLVSRFLIKFLFSEEVLVRSNVYGNAEYGMEPLDHNKISALREHLCERFPELNLEEDGPDWKTCVDAINSSIRKTRHKRKKLRR